MQRHHFEHILAAVDGSPASEEVVAVAADLARKHGATLDLVRAFAPPHSPLELTSRLDHLRACALDHGALHVEAHLVEGAPGPEICRFASTIGADLIVTGRAESVVSTAVARNARCPVLSIPV
jgi:nucleotide-binding universal stress UspA family protein